MLEAELEHFFSAKAKRRQRSVPWLGKAKSQSSMFNVHAVQAGRDSLGYQESLEFWAKRPLSQP